MTASTDPIADMFTRIRNASAVRQHVVTLPHSKVKESVAKILAECGFIDSVSVQPAASGVGRSLSLELFGTHDNPHVTEIVRLSKPGRRSYAAATGIPIVKRGRGVIIISTSKGVMTGEQAKKEGIGGELICRVY